MNRKLAYYYSVYLNLLGIDDSEFRADDIYWNEDASARLAYGIAKQLGIPGYQDMEPKEVWEAIKDKTGKGEKEFFEYKENNRNKKRTHENRTVIGGKSKYRNLRDKFAKKFQGKDATVDPDTGEFMNFSNGFQVAFQTSESEDMGSHLSVDDKEYDRIVRKLEKQTGSKAYVGCFEKPEISFHVKKRRDGMEIARKYNQQSIFNWKAYQKLEWNDENEPLILLENNYYDPEKNHVKGR